MSQSSSPLKAIRAKCLDCSFNATEVRLCPVTSCPIWPFRFGKNPYIKREMTEEQRQAAADRLKKAREKKNDND